MYSKEDSAKVPSMRGERSMAVGAIAHVASSRDTLGPARSCKPRVRRAQFGGAKSGSCRPLAAGSRTLTAELGSTVPRAAWK